MNILTSGVGSEYVLSHLSKFLRAKGHNVIEFDLLKFKDNPYNFIKNLKNQGYAYITSAHTNLNYRLATHISPMYAEEYPRLISPMEIIAAINPSISIYIPHDLQSPYGEINTSEKDYLDIYDYIISPFEEDIIEKKLTRAEVLYGGWIKSYKDINFSIKNSKIRNVYFISNFHFIREHYPPGILVNLYADIKKHTYIKFPEWNDVKRYETEFIKKGFNIIPCRTLSTSVINSFDNIISDNAGSIFAESRYFGKNFYFFKTNIFLDIQKDIINSGNFLPKEIITSSDFANLKKTNSIANKVKLFNFDLVESILNSSLKT